jgi:hypothetical protein
VIPLCPFFVRLALGIRGGSRESIRGVVGGFSMRVLAFFSGNTDLAPSRLSTYDEYLDANMLIKMGRLSRVQFAAFDGDECLAFPDIHRF